MQTDVSKPHCQYKRLENGLHEFVFLSNTRAAVDDYFAILESSRIAQGEYRPDIVRLIIELRNPGTPPVSYMMQRYAEFVRAHKDHLPPVRIVYLYRPGFILSMVRSFIGLMPESRYANRRFFPVTERAQAEAWLLEKPASQE
jgi:hypothetical protein